MSAILSLLQPEPASRPENPGSVTRGKSAESQQPAGKKKASGEADGSSAFAAVIAQQENPPPQPATGEAVAIAVRPTEDSDATEDESSESNAAGAAAMSGSVGVAPRESHSDPAADTADELLVDGINNETSPANAGHPIDGDPVPRNDADAGISRDAPASAAPAESPGPNRLSDASLSEAETETAEETLIPIRRPDRSQTLTEGAMDEHSQLPRQAGGDQSAPQTASDGDVTGETALFAEPVTSRSRPPMELRDRNPVQTRAAVHPAIATEREPTTVVPPTDSPELMPADADPIAADPLPAHDVTVADRATLRTEAATSAESPVMEPTPTAAGESPAMPASDASVEEFLTPQRVEQAVRTQTVPEILTLADRLRSGEATRVQIRLDPPELGRVTVDLTSTADGLLVRITATDPLARAALLQDSDHLKQSLADSGINLLDFDVSQEGGGKHSPWRSREQDLPDSPPMRTGTTEPAREVVQQHTTATAHVIDLMI